MRAIAGAIFLTAGLALMALVAVSTWWWFGYGTKDWVADLGDGTLYFARVRDSAPREPLLGWTGGENRGDNGKRNCWTWWAWGVRRQSWNPGWAYTVWPIAPTTTALGMVLFFPGWRGRRRVRRGLCSGCGYSRSGLSEGMPCPECGLQHSC
jgi:hypothetical protein